MFAMDTGQLQKRVIPAVTRLVPGIAFEARRFFLASFGSDWPRVSVAIPNFG